MAESIDRMWMDPHPTHQFEVEIGGVRVGSFNEVSGLSASNELVEIKEGGLNAHNHKFINRSSSGDLTLKRGFFGQCDMFDWFEAAATGTWTERRDGAIIMLFRAYKGGDPMEVARWDFFRALPLKWEGPAMNAMSSAIAVESVTLSVEWIELTFA